MYKYISSVFTMKLLLVFVFLSAVIAVQGKSGRCPLGFVGHGSSCYLFGPTKSTFSEANSFCRMFSSRLAVITSKHEDDFIRGYLLRKGQGQHYWIGGTDMRVEGIWTWENPVRKLSYTNWGPKQPDNYADEHCMVLWVPFRYQWGDLGCNVKVRFVCERRASLK